MRISGFRSGTAAGKGNATEDTAKWAGKECAGAQRIRSVPGSVTLLLLFPLLAFSQDQPPAKKQTPKENAPRPRLDLYGDPLPEGAIARVGTTRFRLVGPTRAIAYSPDGTILATESVNNFKRLWDVNTGKELARFEVPRARMMAPSFKFSPDGEFLHTVTWTGTI